MKVPEFFVRILRALGILHVDLAVRTSSRVPVDHDIRGGDLTIVENDGVRKWACLKCPGRCGATIALSLNPQRRPRWQAAQDWLGRITITPSVHQMNTCGCHFWIRHGNVEWCTDGHSGRIDH